MELPPFDESRREQISSFFKAAQNEDKAAIRGFLATGGKIDERDRAGRTVLMNYELTPEMNLFLISLKADVNAQDRSGISVLSYQCIASAFGFMAPDFDKIKVLLDAGASPKLCDSKGRDLEAQVQIQVSSGYESLEAASLFEFIREHTRA